MPIVAVVACDRFSPFHLAVPSTIFGDILPGQRLFSLRICAFEAGSLRSTTGLMLTPEHGPDGLVDADLVVVPYWRDPTEKPSPALTEALCAARLRGAGVVGLCLGTYALAYAGLLDGHRATTHWEFAEDFRSRFPLVRLDANALYVDDDGLITSAGSAAGLDCCLYLVQQFHGRAVANRIARRMVIPPHRDGGQAQFIERPVPTSPEDERLRLLLHHLHGNLREPHRLEDLARQLMLGKRTFTRLFRQVTGLSVGQWLLSARLQRSQELLEATALSIEAVAEEVGFMSASSLRQHFRLRFGVTPRQWRATFRGTAQRE